MGFLFDPQRELKDATGLISRVKQGGPTERLGTGLIISPYGLIVTAAHVVSDCAATDKLEFEINKTLRLPLSVLVKRRDNDSGVDFALCKVEASRRLSFAAISFSRNCSGDLMLRGYGRTMYDQSSAIGDFVGVLDVSGRADNRLFQYSSEQAAEGGFSGSGVYAVREGGVIAVQTEAVLATSGPHQKTVLSYPLFRARKDILSSGVSFYTRVVWSWRRVVRATMYRPLRAVSTLLVMAAVISMVYWGTLAYFTFRQLALMSTPAFSQLNSAETKFWTSEAALAFKERVRAEEIVHENHIYKLLDANSLLTTVLQLNDYYEGMAACVIEGLCLRHIMCHAEFDRLWDFYQSYHGVWKEIETRMRQHIAEKSEFFIRNECRDQLERACMSIRYSSKVCSGLRR